LKRIIDNPFLGEQWLPLARVIRYIIKKRPTGEDFYMRLYGPQFKEASFFKGGPIVTVRKTYDGDFVLTISANEDVNPPLDWNQFKMMQFLGFDPPIGFDGDFAVDPKRHRGDSYPYFNAVLNKAPSVNKTIEHMLVALVCVFQCGEQSRFYFGDNIALTRLVHKLDELDRYKSWPGNPKAEIFGFKGANSDLELFGSRTKYREN
jgi:hypothetical protein